MVENYIHLPQESLKLLLYPVLMLANITYNQMTTVQRGIQMKVLDVYCAEKDSSIY
jgi:hypothetical protein